MPSLRFRAAFALVSAAAAAGISVYVAVAGVAGWERDAVDALYRAGGGTLETAMRAFSRIGDPVAGAIVAGAIFLGLVARRRLGDALFLVLAAGGAGLLALLKPVFGRPRPSVEILGDFAGSAYPSGHALLAGAIAAAVAFMPFAPGRRAALAAVGATLAAADGAARVYLGAHYPLDVVGGWAMALAWVGGLAALGARGRR